jgi:hypothetical protein
MDLIHFSLLCHLLQMQGNYTLFRKISLIFEKNMKYNQTDYTNKLIH